MMISESVMVKSRGIPLTTAEQAQHANQLAAERAEERKLVAERAKSAGMKKRQIRDADGKVVDVWMFTTSYYAMGFNAMQVAAAERFGRDWEAAYSGLRGQGFEPSVDGGKAAHGLHHARVDAQTRLQACRRTIGQRAFEIVKAVVVHGASARQIHARGGKDHVTVKSDMEWAFNELDAFYSGSRHKDRTWRAFEEFNSERSKMIEEAEREVG